MKTKRTSRLIVALLMMVLAFTACKKEEPTPPPSRAKTVYVAGEVYVKTGEWQAEPRATLWINGVAQALEKDLRSRATRVFVSGDDVYVVGTIDNRAVVWKNGERFQILTDGSFPAYAHSLFVSDNDVYVAGEIGGNSPHHGAYLWKNGDAKKLTDPGNYGGASAVYVSGSDVYVVGNVLNAGIMLWINGFPYNIIESESAYTTATSLYGSGEHLYVVGSFNSRIGAYIWKIDAKNGKVIESQSLFKFSLFYANSVFVTDNDIYVASNCTMEDNGSSYSAAYLWKNKKAEPLANGQVERLSEDSKSAKANSVYVSGSDVYAVGRVSFREKPGLFAAIWVNGELQELTDGTTQAEAYSVFVK
ncbi:MAG: hypothetical protein GX102_12455 [Porphyromonadaceae bacterium]|nr:hypothetical protein [Porphyromonadaceae bacterium]